MRVNIQSVRDSKRKRWCYDRNRRGEGERITHASPFALHCGSLSKRRKTGSCLVLQNHRFSFFFYCTLLTFNSWHNGQLVTALHRAPHKNLQQDTHTHYHTEDTSAYYEAERNKSNKVGSKVKAAVVKWCQGWQILLLAHCDHCINDWTEWRHSFCFLPLIWE